MGRSWVVRNQRHKATHLRREPVQDHGSANVVRLLKNGETVLGEFVFVRRASREVGFVKVRHVEHQCGNSLRIRNADSSTTTLLRKQPHEGLSESNIVGYVAEGEIVNGEFVFVAHKHEKRGGYVKLRHLKPKKEGLEPAEALATFDGETAAQRWAVLDAGHDGAWLRRQPNPERHKGNILRLVPNGSVVVGEYIHVRKLTGEAGFVRFKDLEQQSPQHWLVRNSEGAAATALRQVPREDVAGAGAALEGERLEGEYVFVNIGQKSGYIKRHYLTALLSPKRQHSQEAEEAQQQQQQQQSEQAAARTRSSAWRPLLVVS